MGSCCSKSTVTPAEAGSDALIASHERAGRKFHRVPLSDVMATPRGAAATKQDDLEGLGTRSSENHAAEAPTAADGAAANGTGAASTTFRRGAPPSDGTLSREAHAWVADEGNTFLILNTVELIASGRKRYDVLSEADPYIRVTTSASDHFSYCSPVRKNDFERPEWAVRVPILVRPHTDDTITIQGEVSETCLHCAN